MQSFGVVSLLTGNFSAGVILMLAGIVFIAIFLFARKRGMYCSVLSFAGSVVLALAIAYMLLTATDNMFFANILSVIFPLSCLLLKFRRSCIFTFVVLTLCTIVGIASGYPTSQQIAFFFVGSFVFIASSGFVVITSKLIDATDNKIYDIKKKNEIKNEFIAQLSYQIRTPLNNIVAIGGLMNETNLNERQRDMMETILASANNMANVINVFASKITSTETALKTNNISFNLQTLMDSIVQLFVGQSEEYNIAQTLSIDPAQYFLTGDPIQIKQIFLNLIDGIIKNKKSEKINIFISYRVSQGTEQLYDVNFEIKVSDQIVFDPEENDWGRPEMINYSISSQMITNMSGGKLTSKYERNYTTLSFTLSFKKSDEEQLKKEITVKTSEQAEPSEAAPSRDLSKVDLKEAKVLLVEDNLINQKIVILSIQKLVKSINVANNGQEAVEKFKASKHDIILMDIQMPVMDGIQATKKIREIEIEKRIIPTPIIAITANALAGDREHCLASGMDEYISKPFQVEVLVSKMKNLLSIGSSIHK